MLSFETSTLPLVRISTPDWLSFGIEDVESALPDPHDVYVDWLEAFEEEPPF